MSVDLSKMSVEEMDDWIGAASTPDLETIRLSTCYNELARRHAAVTAERDRLAEVVAKLPKTKDGKVPSPPCELWEVRGLPRMVESHTCFGWAYDNRIRDFTIVSMLREIPVHTLYSTREAAEAAQRAGEVPHD